MTSGGLRRGSRSRSSHFLVSAWPIRTALSGNWSVVPMWSPCEWLYTTWVTGSSVTDRIAFVTRSPIEGGASMAMTPCPVTMKAHWYMPSVTQYSPSRTSSTRYPRSGIAGPSEESGTGSQPAPCCPAVLPVP